MELPSICLEKRQCQSLDNGNWTIQHMNISELDHFDQDNIDLCWWEGESGKIQNN